MRFSRVAALLLACGCAREVRHEVTRSSPDDLAGFRGPLSFGPGFRLSVDGDVGGTPAEVLLDVASPLSTVTTACFVGREDPPSSKRVQIPQVNGKPIQVPEIVVPYARMGRVEVAPRRAGLIADDGRCVLTLGSDALWPYALELDPELGEVAISPTRPREAYLRPELKKESPIDEVQLIELTRNPQTDWPLVSVRLHQGSAQLTGPFILSTREDDSVLSEQLASSAHLRTDPDLLVSTVDGKLLAKLAGEQPRPPAESRGAAGKPPLATPESGREAKPPPTSTERERPLRLKAHSVTVDSLELTPEFSVKWLKFRSDPEWKNAGAVGILGSDLWGRFHATLDLQAGALVLRRPRVEVTGSRQLCSTGPGPSSEDRCFVLHTRKLGDSLAAAVMVWRELPTGGQLHLEPVGPGADALGDRCRFGLSFPPGDRGSGARLQFPWAELQRKMPVCAGIARRAEKFALLLFEEGPLKQCRGQCAFARDLANGRVLCECTPGWPREMLISR